MEFKKKLITLVAFFTFVYYVPISATAEAEQETENSDQAEERTTDNELNETSEVEEEVESSDDVESKEVTEEQEEEVTTDENQVTEETNSTEAEVSTLSVEDTSALTVEDASSVQDDLKQLGFENSDMEDALLYFQSYYGLEETGEVNEATQNKIDEILSSPLRKGQYHNDAIQLKKDLARLDIHISNSPTEHYGPLTEAGVMNFQEQYGLPVSGIADYKTLDKINELLTGPMFNGLHRDDVVDLKIDLEKLGFHVSSNPTYHYGPITESTVKEFQSYYGLEADGVAGPSTLNKIDEVLNSPFQDGEYNEETIKLKEDLEILGYKVSNDPTTHYGPITASKVKEFQEDQGLKATGIADSVTRAKIQELLDKPLEKGMERLDVIDLKLDLEKLGFHVSNSPTTYYGPITESKVKEFQKYYGLTADGKAGPATLDKIEDIVNSPFQDGKRHEDTIQLKVDLEKLGFHVSDDPTTLYGYITTKKVEEFQEFYNLKVTGIADPVTRNKIHELANAPLEDGMYRNDVIDLKIDLDKLGFHVSDTPTTHYGPITESKVKEFQKYYGLPVTGIADSDTVDLLEELASTPLQEGGHHEDAIQLKKDLETLGFKVSDDPTEYYGPITTSKVKEFQSYYGLKTNGIADSKTLEKIQEILESPLQDGARVKEAIQLKEDLDTLGFHVSDDPTNHYGPITASKVEEFQEYYGLPATGIADYKTLEKIEEILNSPFQYGKNHKDTIQLKKDLSKLGFHVSDDPNDYYGLITTEKVEEFQEQYDLPVSGIADENTFAKIKELLETKVIYHYTNYDYSLQKMLDIQMGVSPQTDKYRNDPAYVLASDIEVYSSPTVSSGVFVRSAPRIEESTKEFKTISTINVEILSKNISGDSYNGSTEWYKIKYNGEEYYVHSLLVNESNGAKVKTATDVKAKTSTGSHTFGRLAAGSSVSVKRKTGSWYEISYQSWRNAKSGDVMEYLDPEKNNNFQHLLLSGTAGLSASQLRTIIDGKGTLDGQEQAFLDASNSSNVNEVYLVSHALLETGHGTSDLASGVYVDKNGNTIRDSNGNLILDKSKVPSGSTKVYNMYGINATDNNAVNGGAKYAYEQGWTTPSKAIIGGAQWISGRYINHSSYQQDTLYKMRWNPQSPGTHQYATDVGWAVKQISEIQDLYEQLPDAIKQFDMPRYK
ncbi:peptidoglycan-binding protein [Gracilibacillus suaedae]|uniref:peptidoglycan-binding protein n=1 Tax=Gracilibacillus suaedae TaxID=2820273 RepID=UPI001ABDA96C|nr:peptidoglycan-binding protein [Gracilibacillus suaedae]